MSAVLFTRMKEIFRFARSKRGISANQLCKRSPDFLPAAVSRKLIKITKQAKYIYSVWLIIIVIYKIIFGKRAHLIRYRWGAKGISSV